MFESSSSDAALAFGDWKKTFHALGTILGTVFTLSSSLCLGSFLQTEARNAPEASFVGIASDDTSAGDAPLQVGSERQQETSVSRDTAETPARWNTPLKTRKQAGWKSAWLDYHRMILPIAVGIFFMSFSAWSLIAVENMAILKPNPQLE